MARKNKSPFTDEELEELRATLFAVTLRKGCASSPLYQKYMGSYNNFTAMRRTREAEESLALKSEEEAIRLLEGKGYKITR